MISELLTVNYALYLLVPVSFLLGSIPFGIIFTKNKGIDIRNVGSSNIGATNVLRAAGKVPAVLTLAGDLLKGALAVLICKIVISKISISSETANVSVLIEDMWLGIAGMSAVLGHMYSIFLSFKGGKGVATGFGFLLVYSPAVAGIILLVWILVAAVSKYSSLAAIIAISATPLVFILFKASIIKVFISIVLAVLVIYKHKSNIKDLIAGRESRIRDKNRV